MTIAAKSSAGTICIGVAPETLEFGIIMPRPLLRIHEIAGVNIGIGAPDTIPVAMTAGLAAGEALIVMARGARFDILPGEIGVGTGISPGIPDLIKMAERNDVLLVVTIAAECLEIVAALALGFLALGIEAMIETIVQVVHGFNQVIAGVQNDSL